MEESQKTDRYSSFVNYVLDRCSKDNGYAAKLRKADNPDTSYQAWELLLNMGVDITKEAEMRAFSLIGASLSRSKSNSDGVQNLGKALRNTLDDKSNIEDSSVALRFRRLLACNNQEELCLVLRPMLSLILSKSENKNPLSFSTLLKEVRWFGLDDEQTQRVKLQWTYAFYAKSNEEE